ncbi:MAG TPA: biotin/lipoyl-containing protein [Ktedonobacteraceae bacterium]|nr:biotin/lipoyl-containing protein [Ktedonobacteraceae bacterium]
MDNEQHENAPWIERVKDLITLLEGSTISEMELTEGGTEIIIRRQPGMMMVPVQQVSAAQMQAGADGVLLPALPATPSPVARPKKEDRTVPVPAPLTGVFYSSPSPTSPAFINVGEVIHAGQIIALIEAMKVFNEIQAEVSGCVTKILATSGDVVQKGDALMRVEPL